MNEYLAIHDVTDWAQEELGKRLSERRIMSWLLDERISVYFSAEGVLHGVAIHHPQGRLETVKVPVPFNGILRAMTPPSNGGSLTASLVEVAFVRGKRYRHEQQATVAGCELPTAEEHGGAVLPGYSVQAMIDFVSIPRDDWLICTDELRALFEGQGDGDDPASANGVRMERLAGSDVEPVHEQPRYEGGIQQGDCDHELADLFNAVSWKQLEAMFPAGGKWERYANDAVRNGLRVARVERGKFNPYLAAIWWMDAQSPVGWDWSKCLRKLANNLPSRSRDSKHLLTGESD